MKELLLLRHAKSSWAEPGQADVQRPLNRRGRRAAVRMGQFLNETGLRPALILCSSAKRTRETLDLIADALGHVPIQIEPGLYLADPATLLARLRQIPANVPSVMVIAHNPGLQELATELAGAPGAATPEDRTQLQRKFPTAALARFRLKIADWKSLSTDAAPGKIKLLAVVTPRDLPEP